LGLPFAGYVFLNRGDSIVWTTNETKSLNSNLFQWEQGDPANAFKVISSKTLKIIATHGTDVEDIQNPEERKAKQPPLIAFPTQGDFEVSTTVKFRSTISYQRAVLGVRDRSDKRKQIRLYVMENFRLETAISHFPDSVNLAQPINHNSEVVYLKIRRELGKIGLYYSTDGFQWKKSAPEIPSSLSDNVDIFFEVLSAKNPMIAEAEFSDLRLKRL
jgi:hypothetical protein